MATIAAAGQLTNTVQTAFDLKKPQLSNILFLKYGEQGLPFFNTVMTLGEVKPVAGETFGHYELGWIHRSFTVGGAGASATAGGNPQTITVSTADQQTTTNAVYPRKFDVVRYSNGTLGTITDKTGSNPTTLQITPQSLTGGCPAVSAGDTIIIITNIWGEGTDQPTGATNPATKYTFKTQIIKETVDITGSAMTNQYWYDVDTAGKSAMPYNYLQLEAEYRTLLRISQAMLWMEETTNTGISGTSMTGIFPWLSNNAPQLSVTPGTFSKSTFDQIDRTLSKRRVGGEYLIASGVELNIDMGNALANLFAQNPILFQDTAQGSKFSVYNGEDLGKKLGVSFDFRSIRTQSGRVYTFTQIPQNSFEQMGGAPGFNMGYFGAVIPLDNGTDAKTGQKMARLQYRYKDYGGVSRMMKVWETGANAKTPTNQTDNVAYNTLHEGGNELFGAETWFLIKPQ